VVISSSQLEIMDDTSSSRLKALRLRLSALEEQRGDLAVDVKLESKIQKIKAILEDRKAAPLGSLSDLLAL